MKRTKLVLAAFLVALLSFGVSPANTLPESQVLAIKRAVANVPILELTPKAADLVKKASKRDKEEVAVTVVQTILSKRPLLAIALVEAIAKAAPEVSPAAAAAAAKICPEQLEGIAQIAATYAPEQASQIAASVAKAVPQAARQVARSVMVTAPANTPQVVEAIIAAVPNSEAQIKSDLTLNVVSVLARASRSSAATAPRAGFIGKIPTPQPPLNPPIFTNTILLAPRSSSLDTIIKQFQTLETSPTVQVAVLSQASIDTINTLNIIGRDTTTSKQEKDGIIATIGAAVSTIVTDADITQADKTSAIKATTGLVSTIMTDPDLTLANKQTLIAFVSTEVQNISSNPANNSASQTAGIQSVAAQITFTISGNNTFTAAQLSTVTNNVAQTVTNVIRAYGSP